MTDDAHIIYCFLQSRRDQLKTKADTVAKMPKPIPQESKDYYTYLKEQIEFFDNEIERLLR